MNGTIYFTNTAELADFLTHFVGSTAVFEVTRDNGSGWKLVFTGGF
jgi:hypothetical protein